MNTNIKSFTDAKDHQAIRSIAVVGGFRGFENNPESKDHKMIMPALDYLRRSGVAVADNPDFDVINFADKRNFLDEETQYDMVFIAHIPNGRNLSWTRMSFNRFSNWTDVSDPSKLANTIDGKNSPDRWASRIQQTGAPIVAAVGTWIEVGVNYLAESENFKGFIPLITPQNDAALVGVGGVHERDKVEKIYGKACDVPYQWLSIAANPSQMGKFVRKGGTTDLAKSLHAATSTPKDMRTLRA